MLGNGELTHHLARKETLLRASEANRATLNAEATKLREVAAWVDTGIALARKAKTLWSVVAPLISAWRTPKPESPGLFTKLTKGFALARSLTALWRNWRGPSQTSENGERFDGGGVHSRGGL